MNKERLENLIVALAGAQKFAMYAYAHICGTPACVLGHYAARRDLQDAFKLDGMNFVPIGGEPRDDNQWTSPFVLNHFGITAQQATELFSDYGCEDADTAQEAQAYIRKFIDNDGKVL